MWIFKVLFDDISPSNVKLSPCHHQVYQICTWLTLCGMVSFAAL